MENCKTCGKQIDLNNDVYFEAAHQITKENYYFDTKDCRRSWAKGKIIILGIISVLCLVVLIVPLCNCEYILSWAFMLPYMIRIAYFKLRGLFKGESWVSEFLGFFIVLIATLTVVYPIIKLIKEFKYYISIMKD